MTRRVVMCGGGLAGMAAAVEASILGAEVTLVERRPFLGGKAFSFTDEFGVEVDNGQHVFLGCCTGYRAFLRLIGADRDVVLQPRLDVTVRDRSGRRGSLRAAAVPEPFHMLRSFAAFPFLSTGEKARVVRALGALEIMSETRRASLDDVTFADWLRDHGQTDAVISRFWDLFVVPTCNDASERVSAAIAAFVFREGFLGRRDGSAIGWARVGLTTLVDAPLRTFLTRRGGTVRTGHGVLRVADDGVVLTNGDHIAADRVILALPPDRAAAACPQAVTDPGLGSSPIVNVHVWVTRPVMDEPFVAVIDGPAQWVFNRTAMTGRPDGPHHHLVVSISDAHTEVDKRRDALVDMVVDELTAMLPAMSPDLVHRATCIKEPDATFAVGPGQAARRPGPGTPLPHVTLAGAWTDTGWPATMEGAVRSGVTAARHALGDRSR